MPECDFSCRAALGAKSCVMGAHRAFLVFQSPERAYDIAFFDEFARAAGWTERLSLENPVSRPPS